MNPLQDLIDLAKNKGRNIEQIIYDAYERGVRKGIDIGIDIAKEEMIEATKNKKITNHS